MQKKRLISNIMLFITTMVWGVSFVVASEATEIMGPFTLNSIRFLIGWLVLLPVIKVMDGGKKPTFEQKGGKKLIVGGILCGLAVGSATTVQQIGLVSTSAGKAGFLTALYIIFVPVLGIFLGKRPTIKIWAAALMGLFGIYMLSVTEALTIEAGDLLIILCAVIFAVHFLLIDHYSPITDSIRLSAIQFLTAGLACFPFMLILERPSLELLWQGLPSLLYMGVLASGMGFTCQVVAQKYTEPVTASLICSFESVFAALAGWALLNEVMTAKELAGCGLLFCAVILAQLPGKTAKAEQ